MFENTADLAENKLLLIYILDKIHSPISNTQLTEIVLENNFMNYFTFQQYISELNDSDFLHYSDINGKSLLSLTNKGEKVLSFFKDRIPEAKILIVNNYLKERLDLIKKELTIHSDYLPLKDDNFIVELTATEGNDLLLNLKLSVPSKKQAVNLCHKWQENSSSLYNDIVTLLLKNDQ